MAEIDDSTIVKKAPLSSLENNASGNNYRLGRAVAIVIFWVGAIAAIVGFGDLCETPC
jgi:hypothetical protein